MQVPDEIRKCVVFLQYKSKAGGLKFAGTAFFVSVDPKQLNTVFGYLVTAKHVITNIQKYSDDGIVLIRINTLSGGFETIPIHYQSWVFHPSDASVDVAAIAWMPDMSRHDFRTYPEDLFLSDAIVKDKNIGVGDEVFMTGLFVNHVGKEKNIPIVRIGNIACKPEEKIKSRIGEIDAYIIEARSIGGLSGSPVFVNPGSVRTGTSTTIGGGQTHYLMGLIHGHWEVAYSNEDSLEPDATLGEEARANLGMAIVIPVSKISEVINQTVWSMGRQAHLDDLRKK